MDQVDGALYRRRVLDVLQERPFLTGMAVITIQLGEADHEMALAAAEIMAEAMRERLLSVELADFVPSASLVGLLLDLAQERIS